MWEEKEGVLGAQGPPFVLQPSPAAVRGRSAQRNLSLLTNCLFYGFFNKSHRERVFFATHLQTEIAASM